LAASRDQLRELGTSYEDAVASFRWPDVGPEFNFVHDWFDRFARGNDQPALVIVEEDGARSSYSFDEIVTRSVQVAAYLAGREPGRQRRGDAREPSRALGVDAGR
jgi:acetyl-CoA synthetase